MIFDTPIKIGSAEAQCRLVMPPMQTNMALGGHVTEKLADYYRARSLGSRPGIIITEHSCIAPNGRASENQLSIAGDDCIPEHKMLTDAIHAGGSLAFVQLNHAGSNGIDEPVSASEIPSLRAQHTEKARPLTASEIKALTELYAKASERALKAGYDGVEIHCAHGYLLNQFYSPLTNKRTDEYGGSLENRLRFLLEAVAAVRETIGDSVPLAVRLGGSDYMPGGATEEDAAAAAVMLEKAGVNLIDVSGGMCGFMRPDHSEAGYFSSMSRKIKDNVTIPVLVTGGVKTVSEAESLLEGGAADLIGVGRALMRDPDWRK